MPGLLPSQLVKIVKIVAQKKIRLKCSQQLFVNFKK